MTRRQHLTGQMARLPTLDKRPDRQRVTGNVTNDSTSTRDVTNGPMPTVVALLQHMLVLGPLPVSWVLRGPTRCANPQLSSVPSRDLNYYIQDLLEIVYQATYAVGNYEN